MTNKRTRKSLLVGLTGSIGMGKSTVGAMFAEEGVPLFDADAEVRAMQGPGGELVEAIEAAFPGTTSAEGVDRARLGSMVFGSDEALGRLETIVHPAVAEKRQAFIEGHRDSPILLFDIPLLFEKGGAERVDQIIVVSAPLSVQRERVLARPGMTAQKFEDILALQTPDAEKRARADHIIDTSGDLGDTRAQVKRILTCLRGERVP